MKMRVIDHICLFCGRSAVCVVGGKEDACICSGCAESAVALARIEKMRRFGLLYRCERCGREWDRTTLGDYGHRNMCNSMECIAPSRPRGGWESGVTTG